MGKFDHLCWLQHGAIPKSSMWLNYLKVKSNNEQNEKLKSENLTVFLIYSVFALDDTLQKKVSCTACGKQVNQFQRNSVCEHPVLKVLICKVKLKCIRFTFPSLFHSSTPVFLRFSVLDMLVIILLSFPPVMLQLLYKRWHQQRLWWDGWAVQVQYFKRN